MKAIETLRTRDFPITIGFLDRLLVDGAGRPARPGYQMAIDSRIIEWDVLARALSSTELAVLETVRALRRFEVGGYLPDGHPWARALLPYLTQLGCS